MEVVQRYTVDFHEILKAFNFASKYWAYSYRSSYWTNRDYKNNYWQIGYIANGSVYFDVVKFNETKRHRLSGRNIEDMPIPAILTDKLTKKPQDFALEKKQNQHIMRWPSHGKDFLVGI
jgi:cysteinyl-tRNA synthetase